MDVSSWTQNIAAALIQIRGEGASSNGYRLPLISPLDTIPVIGRYAPLLENSIRGLQIHHNESLWGSLPQGAINKRSVEPDGVIGTGVSALISAGDLAGRISISEYLAGYGVQPLPYNRRTKSATSGIEYTFFIGEMINEGETALVSALRQAVREWQRAIDASVSAILASPLDLTKPMRASDNASFWAAIRGLAGSLDAVSANPPEDVYSRIKGATQHALDKTGQFVGESAAKVADQVGRTAGQVAKGFFGEAGATAIVVAGLAVYVVLH